MSSNVPVVEELTDAESVVAPAFKRTANVEVPFMVFTSTSNQRFETLQSTPMFAA